MECAFEDMIVRQFPLFVQPIVKDGVKYIKENATSIAKEGAKQIISLNPASHAEKLSNFAKFAESISNANDQTQAADILVYVGDYWDKFDPNECNALSEIGTYSDDVPKMLKECKDAIDNALNKMFVENFRLQGSVIMVQYFVLWYLYEQSKRGDNVIANAHAKMEKIQNEYIIPAMLLMYVQTNEDEEEKSPARVLKTNISPTDREKIDLYLKCAVDRLDDHMEILEDQKHAAHIYSVFGAASTLISAWFTGGLFSGAHALSGSAATANTSLFYQQAVFTGLSGTATVGLAFMTGYWMNAQKCQEILDKMAEMKRTIGEERAKLNQLIGIVPLLRDR